MKKNLRNKILAKYDSHCAYCGIHLEYDDMQVDHIKAQALGGYDSMDNYNPSCRSCNASKSTYTIEKFRTRLIEDVMRMRRDSAKFRILERFGIVGQQKAELKFYFEELPPNSAKEQENE